MDLETTIVCLPPRLPGRPDQGKRSVVRYHRPVCHGESSIVILAEAGRSNLPSCALEIATSLRSSQ